MPRLIGIAAAAPRSGKTTVAELLEKLAPGTVEIPMAEALKEMLRPLVLSVCDSHADAEMFMRQAKEAKLPVLDVSFRHLCETIEDWGYDCIDPRVWLRVWRHKVEQAAEIYGVETVTASDVRRLRALAHIRSMGGEVWFVHRSEALLARPTSDSEVIPEMCDRIIYNDGTLFDLERRVEICWKSYAGVAA